MPRDDDDDRPRRPRRKRRSDTSRVLPIILIVVAVFVIVPCGLALIPIALLVRDIKGTVDQYQARKDESARKGEAGKERKRQLDAEKAAEVEAAKSRPKPVPTDFDRRVAESAVRWLFSKVKSGEAAAAYKFSTTPAFRARTTEAEFSSLLTAAERAERWPPTVVANPLAPAGEWSFTCDVPQATRTAKVTVVKLGDEWLVDRIVFVPK